MQIFPLLILPAGAVFYSPALLLHFSNGNAENVKIHINLESLGIKLLIVLKFPFEVKCHFQPGFLFYAG